MMSFDEQELKLIYDSVRRDYNQACEYNVQSLTNQLWDLMFKLNMGLMEERLRPVIPPPPDLMKKI